MPWYSAMKEGRLERDDQSVFWRRYDSSSTQRPLLMLHGAGVAGELTWTPVVDFMSERSVVLVPDLRGGGNTHSPDGIEHAFEAHQVVDDLVALLDAHQIDQCDVVGYSFGGLMAMLLRQRLGSRIHSSVLIEPGLLERADIEEMRRMRGGYRAAAENIRSGDAAKGIVEFLDLISPRRSRNERVERLVISRLGKRPLGFANALDCVTRAILKLDRERILNDQGVVLSLVGGNSPETLKNYHHWLSQNKPGWTSLEISGTDHSLPYQKPRRIAALLNQA